MRKKGIKILSVVLMAACLAHAQEPATGWEDDPLDVIEPNSLQQDQVSEPTVPDFQEVPEEGAAPMDVAEPEAPASLPESPPEFNAEVPAPAYQTPEVPFQETAVSYGNNDPDFNKESRFNSIYKKYNRQPTAPDVWEKVLGERQAETYNVQKGDTLWDISKTLFGDSYFWPKVWALNKEGILNPHEINPLMSIQFFPGSAESVPTVNLAEASTVEKDAAQVVVDSNTGAKEFVSIPKARYRTPVLKKLPESMPRYQPDVTVDAKTRLEIGNPRTQFPPAPEYLSYYLSDKLIEGDGFISSTGLGSKTAAEFQNVYVRIKGTPAKSYSIQKNLTLIKDPRQEGRKAQMVEYQGELEVHEKVSEHGDVYRAMITKSISPVDVGSILTPGKLPMIDISPAPITSGVGGMIIGGQFDKGRALFGSSSLVFLDAGSQNGLQLGQNLKIYADEKLRNKKTEAEINDRAIGTVKIVRLSSGFATAYVISSLEDILPGDYVGTGKAQAFMGPASSASGSTDLEQEFDSMPDSAAPTDSGSDDGDLEL